MLKEALLEVLPDVLRALNEEKQPKKPMFNEEKIGSLIDAYKPQTSKEDFSYEIEEKSKPSKSSMPNNPKKVINGEKFVSGKGVLEWFSNQNDPIKNSEFNHSEKDMDDFIYGKLLGKKN